MTRIKVCLVSVCFELSFSNEMLPHINLLSYLFYSLIILPSKICDCVESRPVWTCDMVLDRKLIGPYVACLLNFLLFKLRWQNFNVLDLFVDCF